MGRAYDYAFRPLIGAPPDEDGGTCDDRPHRVELYAASATGEARDAAWQAFSVCPEHESQLRRHDEQLVRQGTPSRFRTVSGGTVPTGRGG